MKFEKTSYFRGLTLIVLRYLTAFFDISMSVRVVLCALVFLFRYKLIVGHRIVIT